MKATPRLLALLEALLDRPGRLVDKQELLDRVWEGTNVTEANLTVQVSKLRRLLGEPEDRPFIETVPTRGYRFLVPVRVVTPACDASGVPMAAQGRTRRAPSRPAARGSSAGRRGDGSMGGPVVDAGGGLVALSASSGTPPEWRCRRSPPASPTTAPGDPPHHPRRRGPEPRLVRMGEPWRSRATATAPALYLLELDRRDEPPVRVGTSGPARSPDWSPDGAPGLRLSRNGQDDLCLVDRDGRNERVVAAQPQDEVDPAWSPDGRRLPTVSTTATGSSTSSTCRRRPPRRALARGSGRLVGAGAGLVAGRDPARRVTLAERRELRHLDHPARRVGADSGGRHRGASSTPPGRAMARASPSTPVKASSSSTWRRRRRPASR